MASRWFFTVATLLIAAGAAGFFVSAGWVPWTYPVIFLAFCLAVWGFVAREQGDAACLRPQAIGRPPELIATTPFAHAA
jgi:hypothetical protein